MTNQAKRDGGNDFAAAAMKSLFDTAERSIQRDDGTQVITLGSEPPPPSPEDTADAIGTPTQSTHDSAGPAGPLSAPLPLDLSAPPTRSHVWLQWAALSLGVASAVACAAYLLQP